jgi:hypothetical protein
LSHGQSLTENRSERKRNAVIDDFGHRKGVRKRKKTPEKKAIKSELQRVFLERVGQEMRRLRIENPTQLSKFTEYVDVAPPQTTLNDILSLQADPRLSQVYKIAQTLGVPAVSLLTEMSNSGGNIHVLPGVPPISRREGLDSKMGDRKKRTV